MISHVSSLRTPSTVRLSAIATGEQSRHTLFLEHSSEKPDDNREVLALVVCGENDGVLVSVTGGE